MYLNILKSSMIGYINQIRFYSNCYSYSPPTLSQTFEYDSSTSIDHLTDEYEQWLERITEITGRTVQDIIKERNMRSQFNLSKLQGFQYWSIRDWQIYDDQLKNYLSIITQYITSR